MYSICLSVVIKLCISITFFAVYLQSIETYPTCLRQTGISLGMIASNAVGVVGPYIVYLVKFKIFYSIYSEFNFQTPPGDQLRSTISVHDFNEFIFCRCRLWTFHSRNIAH